MKQNAPSLVWPRITAIVMVLVFLSGISEVFCLAAYAHQTNYSVFAQTAKILSKPNLKESNSKATFAFSQSSENSFDEADKIGSESSDM